MANSLARPGGVDTALMAAGGLEAIFLHNRAALLRFLAARGAGADAEDLVQELWVKLTAAPGGPVREPLAYLYRMADNLMIDRARARQRQQRRDEAWHETAMIDSPGAERGLVDREALARVERGLAALPPRTLAIFRRYRLDGIRQQEIAAEMELSLSAVEKHLQRAYRTLLELKRAEIAEDGDRQRLQGEGARHAAE